MRYPVDGVTKIVRFWAMPLLGGDFVANDEADELNWLDTDKAKRRLSYDGDRSVVDSFVSGARPTAAIILIRHARAGKRSALHKSDSSRPLEPAGLVQAAQIAASKD